MNQPLHLGVPELWLRPSPVLSFDVLYTFCTTRKSVATPRVGKRDGSHPKGYVPGTSVILRLFDGVREERLREQICITSIVSKPLRDFALEEFKDSVYHGVDWRIVQQELSFFEERPVADDEMVSIVEFSHIT